MDGPSLAIWPALAGIALPLFLVPAIILLRHSRLKRQWAHLERMEAIKRGVPAPSARPTPGAGAVGVIGVGVPIAAVFCAWMSTLAVPHGHGDYSIILVAIIWGGASIISAMALATALVLGVLQHRALDRAAKREAHASAKPAYDPDAFDLSGHGAY